MAITCRLINLTCVLPLFIIYGQQTTPPYFYSTLMQPVNLSQIHHYDTCNFFERRSREHSPSPSRIREARNSIIGPEPGSPDWGCRGLPQSRQTQDTTLTEVMISSTYFSNALHTDFIILFQIIWGIKTVVKQIMNKNKQEIQYPKWD